jgi:hypothetical protein
VKTRHFAQGAATVGVTVALTMCPDGKNMREATDPMRGWSVGGDATTNVIGHAFVPHADDAMPSRIGCGVITAP